jgi:hypothetical protein
MYKDSISCFESCFRLGTVWTLTVVSKATDRPRFLLLLWLLLFSLLLVSVELLDVVDEPKEDDDSSRRGSKSTRKLGAMVISKIQVSVVLVGWLGGLAYYTLGIMSEDGRYSGRDRAFFRRKGGSKQVGFTGEQEQARNISRTSENQFVTTG